MPSHPRPHLSGGRCQQSYVRLCLGIKTMAGSILGRDLCSPPHQTPLSRPSGQGLSDLPLGRAGRPSRGWKPARSLISSRSLGCAARSGRTCTPSRSLNRPSPAPVATGTAVWRLSALKREKNCLQAALASRTTPPIMLARAGTLMPNVRARTACSRAARRRSSPSRAAALTRRREAEGQTQLLAEIGSASTTSAVSAYCGRNVHDIV